MKKSLLVAALVSSGALVNVQAADFGTIEFSGEIKDATCEVAVDGSTANETVTLLPVGTSSLVTAGDTTGKAEFKINVTKCAVGTKVLPYFESGASVDVATGRLNNDAGTGFATNVQLEILEDDATTPVKVGDSTALASKTFHTIDSTGNHDFKYFVRYYSTGGTTVGDVAARVSYTLSYQ